LLVYSQMQYLLNKPLGFEEDQVVIIENGFAINNDPARLNWERFETFKSELINIQDVSMAGYSSSLPGDILQGFIVKLPNSTEKESLVTRMIAVDDSFSETMGMEVLLGRDFSREFNDSLSMVVNEATVEKLGLSNPVGQKIIYVEDSARTQFTIVGVVRNFHFESLHNAVEPMVITKLGTQGFVNKYAVKVSSDNIQNTLASIEAKWNEFAPKSPFRYYFLDQNLEQFYESEKASGRLFTAFTFLAVMVACIGLLGLSAFIINQKTKEIGVRKVLGGSVLSIIYLLSKDILKLIGIATLIAIPASYYWGSDWLENFAYAVPINWLIFVLSGLGALIIALLTVSFQSTRAALANPVESLRDE
jgi:putative ABC transport system permease protein